MHFFPLIAERYDLGRVMQAGGLVFMDHGAAEVSMYTSDICRTFPVAGVFTPEQRKHDQIVRSGTRHKSDPTHQSKSPTSSGSCGKTTQAV
jgi:hypothetical protein